MTMNDLVGKEFTASFFASGFFVSDVRCKATLSKKNMFASRFDVAIHDVDKYKQCVPYCRFAKETELHEVYGGQYLENDIHKENEYNKISITILKSSLEEA